MNRRIVMHGPLHVELGKNSSTSKVMVEHPERAGELVDISHAVTAIDVSAEVGQLTQATLRCWVGSLKVDGVVIDEVVDDTPDMTTYGDMPEGD